MRTQPKHIEPFGDSSRTRRPAVGLAGYRGLVPTPKPGQTSRTTRDVAQSDSAPVCPPMVLIRREIGDVLRDARQDQGRTLREVSSAARVSLGYLSEVERGQKEASSELLASICGALHVPLSNVLREVSDRVAVIEGVSVPDTVPAGLAEGLGPVSRSRTSPRDGLVSAA